MASIQDRIAALNMNHVGRAPEPTPSRPSPPPRPTSEPRVEQNAHGYQEDERQAVGNTPSSGPPPPPRRQEPKRLPLPPPRPPLPGRKTSQTSQSPSLPPRKGSENALARRDSQESIASTRSTHSTTSALTPMSSHTSTSRRPSFDTRNEGRIRAPDVSDPSLLPALPPKKNVNGRPSLTHAKSTTDMSGASKPQLPARPPPLPQRKASEDTNGQSYRTTPILERGFSKANQAPARKSALDFGLNKSTETPPIIPHRPGQTPSDSSNLNQQASNSEPPPIPISSKPNLAALQASKPTVSAAATSTSTAPTAVPVQTQGACLICRDFSKPDQHAARFPRQSIPSQDLGWLAQQLTAPFPSATDKARVLFTWMHHNVAYNTQAFFSGNLKPSTPSSTISSGLAVCEGYAGLFTGLASQVGLESVVVGGDGKGFGYKPLQPGEPIPPFSSNHAWNAVKIDNGEWKLIDCCWGAGNVRDDQSYEKRFTPEFFTMSNNDFGIKHFPSNQNHFYRTDGRQVSWEEYCRGPFGPGEDLQVYSGCTYDHGLSPTSFMPTKKHIKVRGVDPKQRIQFQCSKVCEHWDNERNGAGKPYVLIIAPGTKGGKKTDPVPMKTNGRFWWCDVAVGDLGSPGQTVSLYSVETVSGQNARGMTVDEFNKKVGRYGMSFGGVAAWQLI